MLIYGGETSVCDGPRCVTTASGDRSALRRNPTAAHVCRRTSALMHGPKKLSSTGSQGRSRRQTELRKRRSTGYGKPRPLNNRLATCGLRVPRNRGPYQAQVGAAETMPVKLSVSSVNPKRIPNIATHRSLTVVTTEFDNQGEIPFQVRRSVRIDCCDSHGRTLENMETLAQRMIAGHYGKPVNPSFVAIEIAALMLGHAAGTLDHAHGRLYASLVAAGQIQEPSVASFS